MANIKSQKKRIKTNERSRVRNKAVKSALRTHTKRVHQAIESGDAENARVAFRSAGRALDKAASAGVIHANNAANRKSALARRLNASL